MTVANPTGRFAQLHDERGFGLIEVLVSALLMVLVASGVYLGLDGASATSGVNKRRSVSSELAQQDQDRMRSMTVNDLSNYRDTRTVTVASIDYTIDSHASWVTDSTGSASCTSGATGANYLNIVSTVRWPTMGVPPVTVESVVAPPVGSFSTDQGSLAVQVRDRNGTGVAGVDVTLTGARNYTDVTNTDGCVLWGYLPVGNYTVDVAKAGFVDPQGVLQPSKPIGVVGASTNTLAFDYDLGGRIQANYETWSGSAVIPANGTEFTAVSSYLTVPLAPFGDGAPHASFTSSLVFPFTSPYGVYAGNCAGADPLANGQSATLAQVDPGATAVVGVREPPINLRVVDGGVPVANATVKLAGLGSGCGALPGRSTGATGYLLDPAYPYGRYSVCAQAGGRAQTTTMTGLATLDNTSPTGIPASNAATFDMASAPVGVCP
ncbi:MAG TPA: carboxypeptidase regulatory-like domain-containing protein [Conexibacter sp.]|nr:carboxypeptidase regulatory-like domain-containing protein [Conexibacter sp.]